MLDFSVFVLGVSVCV